MPLNKAGGLLFNKDIKLKRKRREKESLRVVGGYLVMAAKALIVSELIAIFYAGHGKS